MHMKYEGSSTWNVCIYIDMKFNIEGQRLKLASLQHIQNVDLEYIGGSVLVMSMLMDPLKMRMEYAIKYSIFLQCYLKFCEKNPMCGSSRDMWQKPTLN